MSDTLGLLDLIICRIPGLKAREKIELVKKFDREDDFSALSDKEINNILGKTHKAWKMGEVKAMAEEDALEARKSGISWVSFREKTYPPLLREIFDPPVLLFYRGTLPNPEKPLVAVVGTRKPSSQAARRAYVLGRELGLAGIPVVSGLALGIDSMAHRGNIEGRAATIAVLGSGPDLVYPSSNRDLARKILQNGGIILSEYPPGTGPFKSHFPARNRIISALARGLVIVEAPEKSGALITAAFALEQGKDLWVDGNFVSSPGSAGTGRLAEDGAKQLSSAEDILSEWNLDSHSLKKKEKDTAQSIEVNLAASMAEYLDIRIEG